MRATFGLDSPPPGEADAVVSLGTGSTFATVIRVPAWSNVALGLSAFDQHRVLRGGCELVQGRRVEFSRIESMIALERLQRLAKIVSAPAIDHPRRKAGAVEQNLGLEDGRLHAFGQLGGQIRSDRRVRRPRACELRRKHR